MSKHTPGPWYWESSGRDDDLKRLMGSYGDHICWFGNDDHHDGCAGFEPSKEDMDLIAAAPDLLEALEYVLDRVQWDEHCYLGPELELKVSKAIARAKGESS